MKQKEVRLLVLTTLISNILVFPALIKFGMWQFHARLQYILFTLTSCSFLSRLLSSILHKTLAHTQTFSFSEPLTLIRTISLATDLEIPIRAWWAHSGTQKQWWPVTQNPPVAWNSLGKGKAYEPLPSFLFIQEWLLTAPLLSRPSTGNHSCGEVVTETAGSSSVDSILHLFSISPSSSGFLCTHYPVFQSGHWVWEEWYKCPIKAEHANAMCSNILESHESLDSPLFTVLPLPLPLLPFLLPSLPANFWAP